MSPPSCAGLGRAVGVASAGADVGASPCSGCGAGGCSGSPGAGCSVGGGVGDEAARPSCSTGPSCLSCSMVLSSSFFSPIIAGSGASLFLRGASVSPSARELCLPRKSARSGFCCGRSGLVLTMGGGCSCFASVGGSVFFALRICRMRLAMARSCRGGGCGGGSCSRSQAHRICRSTEINTHSAASRLRLICSFFSVSCILFVAHFGGSGAARSACSRYSTLSLSVQGRSANCLPLFCGSARYRCR